MRFRKRTIFWATRPDTENLWYNIRVSAQCRNKSHQGKVTEMKKILAVALVAAVAVVMTGCQKEEEKNPLAAAAESVKSSADKGAKDAGKAAEAAKKDAAKAADDAKKAADKAAK